MRKVLILSVLFGVFFLQEIFAGIVPQTIFETPKRSVCVGNALYIEINYPNGNAARIYVRECPPGTYCVNGMCRRKPSRIVLGPLYISIGPWCSSRYIGKPFCVMNELWVLYRNSRCDIMPKKILTCLHGCSNGSCITSSYYQYRAPSGYQYRGYTQIYPQQQMQQQIIQEQPLGLKITKRRVSAICTPKWVCLDNYWKAYRTRNCSYIAKTYCKNGCVNGHCRPERCIIPDGSSWDCECDTDADCPAGYYCQQRYGPDPCVPREDDC
ncbi:MAG: hypothetical protein J7L44_04685 [Candidatus Diapherotrites archaeon]|nr:hypothetical protein [Candidatus Diapherotrites archaeon]